MGSFEWRRDVPASFAISAEGLRVFGRGPQDKLDFIGVMRMVPADDRHVFLRLLRDVVAHTSVLITDLPLTLPDGRQRVVHIEAEPEFSEQGAVSGYTGILQDVTDRRQAEDRIRQLAHFDALTGLPNRRQLIWRVERAIESARRGGHEVGLLLIDLDRFKVINDTLGHAAGDELLIEVGRRLRGCVRHSDQIMEGVLEGLGNRSHRGLEAVGRLGGDEFVALLPEVADERDAERVADRVLDALREPIFVGGQECFVTASVGIAIYPRDGQSMADLLRNSDVAMYAVKSQGRNASAVYSPQLAGHGKQKLELESALHKALERNEIVLHYQPKIDVRWCRRRTSSRWPRRPA
jgi:GGDEF domain-containing protein